MTGISNVTMEKLISESEDDQIFCFINFRKLIKEKNGQYPFMIMNTDRNNKKSTHWWRLLELHPRRNIFLV